MTTQRGLGQSWQHNAGWTRGQGVPLRLIQNGSSALTSSLRRQVFIGLQWGYGDMQRQLVHGSTHLDTFQLNAFCYVHVPPKIHIFQCRARSYFGSFNFKIRNDNCQTDPVTTKDIRRLLKRPCFRITAGAICWNKCTLVALLLPLIQLFLSC